MRGVSHIIMNVSTACCIGMTGFLILHSETHNLVYEACAKVKNFMSDSGSMPFFIYCILAILAYILGSLLPDCDHQHSLIGRIIYIPFKHRTWTHAIYFPVILFVVSWFYRWVFWLGLGYLLHIFWDSFSASGIDWLYPKNNKHHFIKLYHTSEPTEYAIVGIGIAFAFVYGLFALNHVYRFMRITW